MNKFSLTEMESNGNAGNAGNGSRLFLNIPNNERSLGTDRTYPTTPSTFPQPVFSPQGQVPQGQGVSQQQFANGYQQTGSYFLNNQHQQQYGQYQQQQHAQPAYSQRNLTQEITNGLVHQFSHQNLGGAARGQANAARQPSPSYRPRTAGQQQNYNYMSSASRGLSPQRHVPEFELAPERNPDLYGPNTQNNQKRCAPLAADFFKNNVKRARDRNVRSVA